MSEALRRVSDFPSGAVHPEADRVLRLRSTHGFRLTAIGAVIIVCLGAVTPYLSTVDGYFTGDDFGLVQVFHKQDPLHFLSLFITPWTEGAYGNSGDELRPIIALTYQFDFFWGSSSPVSFHISNLVFHVSNALLVLAIARLIARLTPVASTFAGVLFAVMPVQAETISWISGRADSVPAMFYLGAFLGFALWRRTNWAWLYVTSVHAFFLTLFSKQYAITMIATLFLYDALVEGLGVRSWTKYVRSYAPFILLTCSYLGLRYVLFGNFFREDRIPILTLAGALARTQLVHQGVLISGSTQVVRRSV